VKHKSAPPHVRKFLPFLFILILIPLLGCNLLERIGGFASESEAMSLEDALELTPLDSRPTVLEEMGPPDAFLIKFQELEGQTIRWETWSYFDFTTLFEFIDGELLWTIELEEVPDGSIFAHWYDPADFQAGLSSADVKNLFSDQELLEIDLASLDLEGSLALAGDQILFGFDNDQLIYVETVILSPDEDGKPLGDFGSITDIEDQPPETPPDTAERHPGQFQDDFESDTTLAKPIFDTSIMEYGNIDGLGVLTAHNLNEILLAYYDAPLLQDFILEVEIRPLDFAPGSQAGVMFRFEDPIGGSDYYYIIAVTPSDQQIWLQGWSEGDWAVWEFQDIPEDLFPKYGIYKMKIDCQGDTLRVYLSDQLAAEFTNSVIQGPGTFGLTIVASQAPETVVFDNLVITEHP